MAYNKVVYDGRTLVDLTADTVDPSVLLAGYTAHGKDGNAIVGTFDPLNMFYPVGSYYETSDSSFDPNTAWGGTWVLEAEGQVHVSAGAGYTIGNTGGSTTHHHSTGNHTLTASEIPAHTHGNKSLTGYFTIRKHGTGGANEVVTRSGIVSSIGSSGSGTQTNGSTGATSTSLNQVNFDASHTHDSVGGSGAHNHGDTGDSSNMMPYITVNRWHRTA